MSLDNMWREKERMYQNRAFFWTRLTYLILAIATLGILLLATFSRMVDYLMMYLFIWGFHLLMTLTWIMSSYTNAVSGLWMIFPVAAFFFAPLANQLKVVGPESVYSALVFMFLLRITHRILLLLVGLIISLIERYRVRKGDRKTIEVEESKRYNRAVDYLFYIFWSYHIHLYAAIIVVYVQFAAQFVAVILTWIWHLFSRGLDQIKGRRTQYLSGVVQDVTS